MHKLTHHKSHRRAKSRSTETKATLKREGQALQHLKVGMAEITLRLAQGRRTHSQGVR